MRHAARTDLAPLAARPGACPCNRPRTAAPAHTRAHAQASWTSARAPCTRLQEPTLSQLSTLLETHSCWHWRLLAGCCVVHVHKETERPSGTTGRSSCTWLRSAHYAAAELAAAGCCWRRSWRTVASLHHRLAAYPVMVMTRWASEIGSSRVGACTAGEAGQ
jgi:hypothetical protein